MSNPKAPKIVVAVALAAVYGTGLAMVTLRHAPDNHAVQTAAVAPATHVVEQPAVMTEAPAPIASATVSELAPATREAESVKVDAPRKDVKITREQVIASVAIGSPAETSDVEKPSPTGEAVSAGHESANTTADAPSSEQAESTSAGNDSQVVADIGT